MSEINTNTTETTNAPEVKPTRREKLLAQYNAALAASYDVKIVPVGDKSAAMLALN